MPSSRVLTAVAACCCGAVLLAVVGAALFGLPPAVENAGVALAALAGVAAAAGALAAARSSRRDRDLLADGILGCSSLACYTLDRHGRVGVWSLGAEELFGWSAAEREGRPIEGTIHAPGQHAELLGEVARLIETGRVHPAHRRDVTDRQGRTFVTVCVLVPLASRGRVRRVAVLHVDPHSPQLVEGRWHRLFHAAPAGLLRIGGTGTIEAVNRRLAEWVGRHFDALEGTDAGRAEFFPPDFRERLVAEAAPRKDGDAPRPPFECEVTLVGAQGVPRTCVSFVSARPGSGADVVFVEGASWLQLRAERDAARAAAAAARETATQTVTTHRDLTSSVAQLMTALEAAHAGEPDRRASAELELERSGRRLLADVIRLEEGVRREKPHDAAKVLLVDDNDQNRELLAHMFRTRGADVTAVSGGREAVDAVAGAWFDIVLLDVQMPEMDGYEVVRRIRALPGGDAVSVVALTALGSDAVRDRCLSEGMDDFVSKPITLARISEILARWGKRAAPARG